MTGNEVNSQIAPVGVHSHQNKVLTIVLWVLQIFLGLSFLAAGGGKLMGAEPMVKMFETIGIGQWFRYVTGLLEVGGAILLFVPGFATIAAALLGFVMIGAIAAHLTVLGGNPTAPVVLLIAAALVVWGRGTARPQWKPKAIDLGNRE